MGQDGGCPKADQRDHTTDGSRGRDAQGTHRDPGLAQADTDRNQLQEIVTEAATSLSIAGCDGRAGELTGSRLGASSSTVGWALDFDPTSPVQFLPRRSAPPF